MIFSSADLTARAVIKTRISFYKIIRSMNLTAGRLRKYRARFYILFFIVQSASQSKLLKSNYYNLISPAAVPVPLGGALTAVL